MKRLASDIVVGEVIVYHAPDTFLETPNLVSAPHYIMKGM
jgi:hypothetical protein